MPDYKEMYLKMMRATEKAMNILIQAQQECEELYIADADKEDESETQENGKSSLA